MDHGFWHDKWAKGEIGFHEGQPNAMLVEHFDRIGLAPGARVFLPLCGKTRDIGWLLKRGFTVAGAELSAQAVRELFAELDIVPVEEITDAGPRLSAPGLAILIGDIFTLLRDDIGPVDAVFDRAALVALPESLRMRYPRHVGALTGHAPQILVTFEYDQRAMTGPPFSVSEDELRRRYSEAYEIEKLESREIPGGLKGRTPARETAWLLSPK